MKKIAVYFIAYAMLNLLAACGPSTETKTPATDTTSGASMMKGNTYDAAKINPSAPVEEITLHAVGNSMTEMHYDLPEIKVKANSTVKLTLVNDAKDSSMQHNFVLIDDGSAQQVADGGLKAGATANYTPKLGSVYIGTKVTLPGESTTITFPAPDKGTYQFICTYPGHWQKMQGKFVVE